MEKVRDYKYAIEKAKSSNTETADINVSDGQKENTNSSGINMFDMFAVTEPEVGAKAISDKIELSVSMLEPFPEHPFELYTGDRFEDLVSSIKEHGILTPLLVRKTDNHQYQIMSGHNRWSGAKQAGLKTVPCIVFENLSDDDALMIVLDSNTKQRGITEMKISQQARIFALDVEVNRRQGRRSDLIKGIEEELKIIEIADSTSGLKVNHINTMSEVGRKYGLARSTIARLLRIDTLCDDLKKRIDDEEFGILAGVELSYLKASEQEEVSLVLGYGGYTLTEKKAKRLREVSEKKELIEKLITDILEGKDPKVKKELKSVTIKPGFLSRFYPEEATKEYIEKDVEKSVEVFALIKSKLPEESFDSIKAALEEFLEARK